MMKVNGISLIVAARLGMVAVVGLALHALANVRSRDSRPTCPCCKQLIDPGFEVFLYADVTYCVHCLPISRR